MEKFNSANVLRSVNNYIWQDIVRLSIENNISIERFMRRNYKELCSSDIRQLVNFINSEVKATI